MTRRERVPAPAATEARTLTQTQNLPRNREGVCVPSGGATANDTTSSTAPASYLRTFHVRKALAALLMFAAFGCWIAAVVELPEHVTHAVLWIVAGAASWLVGEAMTR